MTGVASASDLPRCWWFGCWLTAGHYLVGRDGSWTSAKDCPFYRDEGPLDGGYAPRRWQKLRPPPVAAHADGLVFSMMAGEDLDLRRAITYGSDELEQGRFLRHEARGCTLISWWDRTQGDARGACNSTFLVEGAHHVDDMLRWFPEAFPLQARRLTDAGVVLTCVNASALGTVVSCPDCLGTGKRLNALARGRCPECKGSGKTEIVPPIEVK